MMVWLRDEAHLRKTHDQLALDTAHAFLKYLDHAQNEAALLMQQIEQQKSNAESL